MQVFLKRKRSFYRRIYTIYYTQSNNIAEKECIYKKRDAVFFNSLIILIRLLTRLVGTT